MSQEKETFNGLTYLRTAVAEEIMDYINRVANINMADPSKFAQFFDTLETELVKVATNRKFLVLNTNVIRETHQRVLANDSIRMFYMELTTSLQVRIALEHGHGVMNNLMDSILYGYRKVVLKENSDPQGIIQQSADERQLAGQMIVTKQATDYLEVNTWYYGTILCNYFAAYILDQVRTVRRELEAAANKSK